MEDAIYDRIADQPALRNVILMCPAVNSIDASALESLEAIAHRLTSAGIGFHLSEVKGPVTDALKKSDFMEHFKGRIFLSQYEAVTTLLAQTHSGGQTGTAPQPTEKASGALVPMSQAGAAE